MRLTWKQEFRGNYWLVPAVAGLILILIGVLLCVRPEWILRVLAYLVAAVLIIGGCGLLVTAWRMLRGVSYRRIDRQWQDGEPPDDV